MGESGSYITSRPNEGQKASHNQWQEEEAHCWEEAESHPSDSLGSDLGLHKFKHMGQLCYTGPHAEECNSREETTPH
jgi:hypothetical protein